MENLRVPITDIDFNPPVYYCKKTTKKLVVDGNLDKDFWKDAEFTDLFVDIEGDKKPSPRYKTRAKMLWDNENFYFGAVLEGDEIWGNLTQRDCVIFYDNDFEIFIDPDSDTHRYFEFEMNVLNTVWDLFLTKPYRDKGGNPLNGYDIKGLQTAVYVDGEINNSKADNKKWSVEVVIPFEAIIEMSKTKKVPQIGEYYRVNFSRVQWKIDVKDNKYVKRTDDNGNVLPEDNWVWAPTGIINIHYPELWGFVFFTENGEKYEIPEVEYTKWELRKLYYYQHRHYDRYGYFTDDIKCLLDENEINIIPNIQVTDNTFEMSLVTNDSREKVVIYSDGMTEVLENKKKIPYNIKKLCNDEEIKYLEFLYNNLPVSDFGVVDDEFLLNVVRHSLFVKNEMKWYENLSEELFLNYILVYRVNNENPVFYHKVIYDMLSSRVKGMSLRDAIIEINYWCLEKATYQSTNERTGSPFTIMNSAFGRCGEESTFTVSALRAMGIAARQCYAPRWSHCDDNHAWVEVFTGDKWEYLGACEPEMQLNNGWFNLPASKAMLIHTTAYLNSELNENEVCRKNGKVELNVLNHYAKTKDFTVKVVSENKEPINSATVRFEVVNYSEFFPIATLKTDSNGTVKLNTGYGDIIITVNKDDVSVTEKISVEKLDEIEIILKEKKEENYMFTFYPPKGGCKDVNKSKEQEQLEKEKSEKAVKIREEYINTFETEKTALEFEKIYNIENIKEILIASRGNAKEIKKFLIEAPEKEIAVKLLNTLEKKDLTDITFDILKEHYNYAVKYKDKQYEEFYNEIICPRVAYEMIYKYKDMILNVLPKNIIKMIYKDPKYALIWVKSNFVYGNSKYYLSPKAVLNTKISNEISNKILFVAILRTLGIPAKLRKQDKYISCYKDGKWHILDNERNVVKTSQIIFKRDDASMIEYFSNFTIGKKINGIYKTLDLSNIKFEDNQLKCNVESGQYRLILTNRQPDESNIVDVKFYEIKENETYEIKLQKIQNKKSKNIVKIKDIELVDINNEKITLLSQLDKEKTNMFCFLDLKAEPTEHLLNEMSDLKNYYKERKENLILIVKDINNIDDMTLNKLLSNVNNIKLFENKDFDIDYLKEKFDLKDKNLPLVVISKGDSGLLAFSGYQVGIGEMILKCL